MLLCFYSLNLRQLVDSKSILKSGSYLSVTSSLRLKGGSFVLRSSFIPQERKIYQVKLIENSTKDTFLIPSLSVANPFDPISVKRPRSFPVPAAHY